MMGANLGQGIEPCDLHSGVDLGPQDSDSHCSDALGDSFCFVKGMASTPGVTLV